MNEQKKQPESLPSYISLPKALLYIFLSVLLISGSNVIALLFYQQVREKKRLDPAYTIVAVVQTSLENEGLKTVYFTELLELSVDNPKNLYSFNVKEAEQKILGSPLIKEVKIRKIQPGTIHIDYVLRKPIAFLADYSNSAIDSEGVIFPFKPFFTPKKLPEIYLGNVREKIEIEKIPLWGCQLSDERIKTAFNLLQVATEECCDRFSSLSRIDLSQMDAPSIGRCQIAMIFEERSISREKEEKKWVTRPYILRLTPTGYHQELANFLQLRKYLRTDKKFISEEHSKAVMIDLRLSDLAFIALEE
jgi:POTRA domain, FtsQ-type